MCGRFAVTADPALLAARLDAIDETVPPAEGTWQPNYNVAPTTPISTLVSRHPRERDAAPATRRLRTMRWGLLTPATAAAPDGSPATGGPLLVYALGKESLDKHAFRSTLATSWLVLNIALTTTFALDGRYDGATLGRMALLVPLAPFGIAIGELVHRRVDERHFKITVFSLLIAAALSLTVR